MFESVRVCVFTCIQQPYSLPTEADVIFEVVRIGPALKACSEGPTTLEDQLYLCKFLPKHRYLIPCVAPQPSTLFSALYIKWNNLQDNELNKLHRCMQLVCTTQVPAMTYLIIMAVPLLELCLLWAKPLTFCITLKVSLHCLSSSIIV
uniref:Uncharacterized protein n=1 Tax=Rhipicephalus zambeziensis TaxID=60191 RepID=A0A224YCG3_9ACAR